MVPWCHGPVLAPIWPWLPRHLLFFRTASVPCSFGGSTMEAPVTGCYVPEAWKARQKTWCGRCGVLMFGGYTLEFKGRNQGLHLHTPVFCCFVFIVYFSRFLKWLSCVHLFGWDLGLEASLVLVIMTSYWSPDQQELPPWSVPCQSTQCQANSFGEALGQSISFQRLAASSTRSLDKNKEWSSPCSFTGEMSILHVSSKSPQAFHTRFVDLCTCTHWCGIINR